MVAKPYKKVGCLDLNADSGCGFEVRAESEDEVLRMVAEHGKREHQMPAMSPDMAAQIRATITSVTVNV